MQAFLAAVGVLLTALTAVDRMPPALLLTLTFALGVGQALTLPAWQAVIPELVPRAQLVSAAALGSISVNLARSVGPAVAGVLVAQAGVAVVFAVNAASFAIFAFALFRWRPDRPESEPEPERFAAALRAGGRYVRHSPVVRRILLRAASLVVALAAAGAGMLAAALTVLIWPLVETRGVNREPAIYWPEPHLALAAHPRSGPVVVTIGYTVPPERQQAFVAAMRAVGRSRRRTGAMRWGLLRAGEREHGFVEVYQVPSWEEHLRQHGGRLTGADQAAEERARALVEGEPEVTHLLPADPEG